MDALTIIFAVLAMVCMAAGVMATVYMLHKRWLSPRKQTGDQYKENLVAGQYARLEAKPSLMVKKSTIYKHSPIYKKSPIYFNDLPVYKV